MIGIQIADINILLHNRYRYTESLCRKYKTDSQYMDFAVRATDADIAEEIKSAELPISPGYAEAVCLHREIAERLWQYHAFLLHAAFIECDGVGYAFAARSGVGKSTHIGLWKKNFGERVHIINGDKPILKIADHGVIAYGTPWNGKEGFGENRSCPLRALCFLERGIENRIEPISTDDAVARIFPQIYLPQEPQAAAGTLELLDVFVKEVSFFRLACNMEDEAAIVAHKAMSNIDKKGTTL